MRVLQASVFIFYFWVSAVFSLDVYTTCQFELKMEVFTISLLTHNYLQFISLPFCFLTPFNFSNNVLDEAQVTTYLSNNLHISFIFFLSLLTLIGDVQIGQRLSFHSFILFTYWESLCCFPAGFIVKLSQTFFAERKQPKKSQSTEQYTGKRTNEDFRLSSLVGITK